MYTLHLLRVFLLLVFVQISDSKAQYFDLATFTDRNSVRLEVTFENIPSKEFRYEFSLTKKGALRPMMVRKNLKSDSILISKNRLIFLIDSLNTESWEPHNAVLYDLKFSVQSDQNTTNSSTIRIGFRSFESREGQLWLNGRQIFLRGIAINPPGRGIPGE